MVEEGKMGKNLIFALFPLFILRSNPILSVLKGLQKQKTICHPSPLLKSHTEPSRGSFFRAKNFQNSLKNFQIKKLSKNFGEKPKNFQIYRGDKKTFTAEKLSHKKVSPEKNFRKNVLL